MQGTNVATHATRDDAAALVCGMARWRVAIGSEASLEFERQLRNAYICVDSDIISMYTNPGSSAGYLGLRYYGAGSNANSDDFASAAFLSGGLAQFILFELEGRQSSVEPRLVLPAHEAEIQRGFHRARTRANSAYQQAVRDLREVNAKAKALAESAAGDPKQQGELTRFLREYVAAWLGDTPTAHASGGLPAIEQALRFGELFSVQEGGGDSPYPERIVGVLHYRVAWPVNDFLPLFKLFNSRALRQRARELQVDDRHLERIVREVELDDTSPANDLQLQQLRHGSDAYAMAWLDTVTAHLKSRYPEAATRFKLITGSERLARLAPEHVIPPMALMRRYLRSRLQPDGAQPHPAVGRLKSSLDAVLAPLAIGDGRYSPSDFHAWCQEQSDFTRARNWDGLRAIDESRLIDVVAAWKDVTNLLAASHTQYSVASRQSIVKQLEHLESALPSVSSEQWLVAIERSLELAERELMANASRLSLLMIPVGHRPASRNPPPLRLDFSPLAQEVASKVIWQYSYEHAKDQRDKISHVLRMLQPTKHLVLLLGGLLRCATGDWKGARVFFEMALGAAIDGDASSVNQAAAIEAAYATAVACHVAAQGPGDLVAAKSFLNQARSLREQTGASQPEIRFETEAHSVELVGLWASRGEVNEAGLSDDSQERAIALCSQAQISFSYWVALEASRSPQDRYIDSFCLQELACTALQAHWLSRYVMYRRRLLEDKPWIGSTPSTELVRIALWLADHCKRARGDNSHASPMASPLVRISEMVARRLVVGEGVDERELEEVVTLCEDDSNKNIPLIDSNRFLFLRLLLREPARGANAP